MKILLSILFAALVVSATYSAGSGPKRQPNLRDGLATASAVTQTPTPQEIQNTQSSPSVSGQNQPVTPTLPLVMTADPNWKSPTPSGDLYAPREGWPIGGYGPIVVTPNVRPDDWEYPLYVTPCWGWIDANQVLYCVTSTPAPPGTPTPEGGYPFPVNLTPVAYP